MTRENKLALVLGFGLMLFVGILVSDHLAARQAPPLAANVTRTDPGVPPLPTPGMGERIIQLTSNGVKDVTPLPNPEPTERAMNSEGTVPPIIQEPRKPVVPELPSDVKTYVVKDGDTFSSIAADEYGKRSLGAKLAEFNSINPSKLKIGATVQLPPVTTLDPTAVATRPEASSSPMSELPKFELYSVQQGDTLYRIAQRKMGKAERWKELQKTNSDVLKDGSELSPGMQLRIPVLTASAARTDA